MATEKQTAYLRIIRDIPGSTVQQLALAYDDRFGAGNGQSESSKAAYQCLAKMRSNGWIRAGEPSLGRGMGHHLTLVGGALAGLAPLPPTTLPGYAGKSYPGSPEPTRFVDGAGAPAMVGPVDSVHEQVRQAYAATQEPKLPKGDGSLYNIRSALQDAKRAHEKILDARGGPQVLVDIRFTHILRALDLLVDRLYGQTGMRG